MRELKATGFMHNRVRMIVAMFLTKDLHLHWKKGEQYFMQKLVDGDIASNKGVGNGPPEPAPMPPRISGFKILGSKPKTTILPASISRTGFRN